MFSGPFSLALSSRSLTRGFDKFLQGHEAPQRGCQGCVLWDGWQGGKSVYFSPSRSSNTPFLLTHKAQLAETISQLRPQVNMSISVRVNMLTWNYWECRNWENHSTLVRLAMRSQRSSELDERRISVTCWHRQQEECHQQIKPRFLTHTCGSSELNYWCFEAWQQRLIFMCLATLGSSLPPAEWCWIKSIKIFILIYIVILADIYAFVFIDDLVMFTKERLFCQEVIF